MTETHDTPILPLISHVSLGTNNYEEAKEFYDTVMASIGAQCLMEHPGAAAYGRRFPEFWIQTPHDGMPADHGNGTHIAFFCDSEEQVNEFFETAVDAGATNDGAPGPRPLYGEAYYGCFVLDLDGNKIEAMFWDMDKAHIQE